VLARAWPVTAEKRGRAGLEVGAVVVEGVLGDPLRREREDGERKRQEHPHAITAVKFSGRSIPCGAARAVAPRGPSRRLPGGADALRVSGVQAVQGENGGLFHGDEGAQRRG
jgi:hypothetical protein